MKNSQSLYLEHGDKPVINVVECGNGHSLAYAVQIRIGDTTIWVHSATASALFNLGFEIAQKTLARVEADQRRVPVPEGTGEMKAELERLGHPMA